MANTGDTSQGIPLPLAYGFVCATGANIINQTDTLPPPEIGHFYNVGDVLSDGTNQQICITAGLSGGSLPGSWNHLPAGNTTWGAATFQNQGTTNGNGTQYGLWVLGEGEWDGFATLWNQVAPLFSIGNNYDIPSGTYNPGPTILNPPAVHFHSGSDGVIGAAYPAPSSNGPDMGCDNWISELPPGLAVIPQCYSRKAYYMLKWLPQHIYGSDFNINQIGGNLSPIGHWRALRCRIFDDMGNQVGYQWTQNPAWHWVDAYLRCKFLPRSEYQLTMAGGPPFITAPTPLPDRAKSKFDWGSIYEFSQDCDYILANGNKRFQGNYAFATGTTLAAILEQILLCSRGFQQEYAGKLFLAMDKPRASIFVLKSKHVVPYTSVVDQKEVHQNANDLTYQFLDMLIPAVVPVASINFVESLGYATIVTTQKHPCAPWDQIEIGGSDNPILNRDWQVANIIDDYTFTAGTNDDFHTDQTATGGYLGYPQTRFQKRVPELWHLKHAVARGQIAP